MLHVKPQEWWKVDSVNAMDLLYCHNGSDVLMCPFSPFCRQWKSRATTSPTSCRSPKWGKRMRDCTNAGWLMLITETFRSTKPRPISKSAPTATPGGCRPLKRHQCGCRISRARTSLQSYTAAYRTQPASACAPQLALPQTPKSPNKAHNQVWEAIFNSCRLLLQVAWVFESTTQGGNMEQLKEWCSRKHR